MKIGEPEPGSYGLADRLLVLLQVYTGTEWSENWRAWPHCCGQGGCWMHVSIPRRWCGCGCPWCRLAHLIRRGERRHGSFTPRQARRWRAGKNWRDS